MSGTIFIWFILVHISVAYSFEFIFGECPLVVFESCKPKYVKFIYSMRRKNGTYLYKLDPYNPHLPYDYNVVKQLKIIIHGYGGLTIDSATRNVTKAYKDLGANFIIVDWAALSSIPCYATAYLNTWHVGQCVAVLAASLIYSGVHPDLIHVIGFSLGAHIAGFSGAHINRTIGIPFRRITGLDPALPFFATLKNDWKLDKTDAKFVDVIHTSAGFFGKIEASGHVDFYVNEGTLQPFCEKARYPPLCSHILAGIYFSETIRNLTRFVGVECNNRQSFILGHCNKNRKAIMGEYTELRNSGIYYVKTSKEFPFGMD